MNTERRVRSRGTLLYGGTPDNLSDPSRSGIRLRERETRDPADKKYRDLPGDWFENLRRITDTVRDERGPE
jgi:hypothetical protein